MRRITKWAKKTGVEFALNDCVPVPSDDELKKMPIEDTGREFPNIKELNAFLRKTFPYLIINDKEEIDIVIREK